MAFVRKIPGIFSRGFTLIELMVVMSIIGLLSSVVLVALRNGRQRAVNGRIQEETLSLRSQILIGSSDGSTFSNLTQERFVAVPPFDSKLQPIMNDIVSLSQGTSYGGGTVVSGSDCGFRNEANVSSCSGSYVPTTNSLTIYTDQECPTASGNPPVRAWAIYSAYQPVGTAGYFCADSSNRIKNVTNGFIPSQLGASGSSC